MKQTLNQIRKSLHLTRDIKMADDIAKTVSTEASQLLKKHGFDGPPIDSEFIAEQEGVDVVYVEFSSEGNELLHGYLDIESNRIVVNANDPVEEKLFTIAHELGHFILHKSYAEGQGYIPRLKKAHIHKMSDLQMEKEDEADRFAVQLTVPKSMLERYDQVVPRSKLASLFVTTIGVLNSVESN
jgi:Zn-dependent peptidase ImmA (M78 family)